MTFDLKLRRSTPELPCLKLTPRRCHPKRAWAYQLLLWAHEEGRRSVGQICCAQAAMRPDSRAPVAAPTHVASHKSHTSQAASLGPQCDLGLARLHRARRGVFGFNGRCSGPDGAHLGSNGGRMGASRTTGSLTQHPCWALNSKAVKPARTQGTQVTSACHTHTLWARRCGTHGLYSDEAQPGAVSCSTCPCANCHTRAMPTQGVVYKGHAKQGKSVEPYCTLHHDATFLVFSPDPRLRALPGFDSHARAAGTSAVALPALTWHAKKCVLFPPHACESMLPTRLFYSRTRGWSGLWRGLQSRRFGQRGLLSPLPYQRQTPASALKRRNR